MPRPFEVLTVEQFIEKIGNRKYEYAQVHHTWRPDHSSFTGDNHVRLQESMWNYHVNTRGWSDIGQHASIMPDGMIVTGRDLDRTPAGIRGKNTGAFMAEIIGNFDIGNDKLEGKQLESTLKLYNYLVTQCGAEIIFHREYASKTCPGTSIDKTTFVKQVKNFEEDTPVVKEIPEWKKEGIEYLHEQGLLNDLEGWTKKIDEPMPTWAITLILSRIHKKLKG